MKYTLIWCSRLMLFALHLPFGGVVTYTEQDLADLWSCNETLLRWMAFSKEHPDCAVEYDMLPPMEEVSVEQG